ncbi:MAG: hypothetical protein K2X27_04540 [Candidatus Obscuribacterales bacterium]|nr:hypothetical protein [Candidatus Obscuribacterales bacterium]
MADKVENENRVENSANSIVEELNQGDYADAVDKLREESLQHPEDFAALKNSLIEKTKDWYRELYQQDGILYMDTASLYGDKKLHVPPAGDSSADRVLADLEVENLHRVKMGISNAERFEGFEAFKDELLERGNGRFKEDSEGDLFCDSEKVYDAPDKPADNRTYLEWIGESLFPTLHGALKTRASDN